MPDPVLTPAQRREAERKERLRRLRIPDFQADATGTQGKRPTPQPTIGPRTSPIPAELTRVPEPKPKNAVQRALTSNSPAGILAELNPITGAARAGAATREAINNKQYAMAPLMAMTALPLGGGTRGAIKRAAGAIRTAPASFAARARDVVLERDVRGMARDAYRRIVDEAQPLRDFGRNIGNTERLSHEASRAKGWKGAAESRVRTNFKRVVEGSRGREEPVRQLAKAERIIELHANGTKNVEPAVLAEAQRTVADLSGVPEVRGGVDALRGYYRELLDAKLENGVINKEMYDAIVAKGEAYTPLLPEWIANKKPPTSGGGSLVPRSTGVRKIKTDILGSSETVDPFEQAILDTYEAERTISKQRVTNVVRDIVEADPDAAAPFVRKIATRDAAKHGRVVEANVGGKRQLYEVADEQLYDAWAAFDPKTQSIFQKILAVPKRTLRAGVTMLPDFAVTNAIRDNAQSAVQYGFPARSAAMGAVGGAAVGAASDDDNRVRGALAGAGLGLGAGTLAPNVTRTFRAIGDIVGNKEIYQEWLRAGGGGFGEFYAKPAEARTLIRQMLGDRSIAQTILPFRDFTDALGFIGRTLEEAPRLARFKAARAAGKGEAEAAFRSRDISLDFARTGKDTKGIASVTAFFNAKIQGWDKLGRLLKNPRTAGIAAATITAPSVALWAINKDNDEYWERPQWERNLFWLVPRDEGGFYRVPKPFEIGFIFGSLPERLLDFAYQQDPENLKFALRDMLSTTTDGTLPIPTGLESPLENQTNYDLFRNRPVVSRPDLPSKLQYDDKTSSVAVGIGKLTGISPQKTDNVIRGYTGSAGSLALDMTSDIARRTGLDDRPAPIDQKTPLVSRFVTSDQGRSDDEQNFYRRFNAADEAYRGARELLKRGDEDGFLAFVRERGDDIEAYERLQPIRRQLEDLQSERREILASKEFSPETKREIDALARARARELAAAAIQGARQPSRVAAAP